MSFVVTQERIVEFLGFLLFYYFVISFLLSRKPGCRSLPRSLSVGYLYKSYQCIMKPHRHPFISIYLYTRLQIQTSFLRQSFACVEGRESHGTPQQKHLTNENILIRR